MSEKPGWTRRDWLGLSAASPAAFGAGTAARDGFVDILRQPDSVTALLDSGRRALIRAGASWTSEGVSVKTEVGAKELSVGIEAESSPLLRVRLRWEAAVPEQWRILNDHWERSYGDLEWRGMAGERVLPWYFLAFDGRRTHGYGVATGGSAFAFWQVDAEGISLWLDLRNGGSGVRLGARRLEAAKVRIQRGADGESAFQAAHRFCRVLCDRPVLPAEPVYGGNNWYYTYGRNCSAAAIERESDLVAEWAPSGRNRPFMVIDDGWSPNRTSGPWERGNERFPDMPGLAQSMKSRGVRPGIWIRPLCTAEPVAQGMRLRTDRSGKAMLDPTVPETMERVRQDVRRMAEWGYEMVKHDFSSYDLVGRWGFAMQAEITDSGWHFADRSRTTAEVVLALYRTIREAAGSALLIGCNTFGHLAAGLVELQRTGDDTSGREFHRTRRMGVNTLAFRGPQHRAFFDLDADCAPITPDVPWEMASQWLDLVARSGTALFVSADPATLTRESVLAIRQAFASASQRRLTAEPLDWMNSTTPSLWRIEGRPVKYKWYGPEGAMPFPK